MAVEKRLDKIEKRLDSIDANLERHMKRSDELEAQTAPVLKLMVEVKGAVKFIKFVGVLAGIIECIRIFWH